MLTAQSRSHSQQNQSLFVAIQGQQQVLLKAVLLIVGAIALVPLLFAESSAVFAVFAGSILLFVARAVPLLFSRSQLGLFHPVVFFSALWLVRSLPSLITDAYKVVVYGSSAVVLQHHDALVGLSADNLNWLVAESIYLTLLGTLAYYAGFWLGPKVRLPQLQLRVVQLSLPKIWAAIIGSAILFAWYINQRGGIAQHFLSWESGRFLALEGDGFFLQIINVAMLACLLWFCLSQTAVRRLTFWLAVSLSLAMKFIATGSRSEVIFSLSVAVLVWMLRERRIVPLRGLLFLVFALAVFGALGSFRAAITGEGVLDYQRLTDVGGAFERAFGIDGEAGELNSRSGRQNAVLPILHAVPQQEPLLFGSSYLSVLTLPIPRALWPDKPRSIGAKVNEAFFSYDTAFSIPPGPVGEAFWNFHIPGVLLVFFLFGVFHQALYRWFETHAWHRASLLIYVTTLLLFSAPDSASASKWLFSLVPLLLLLWWCRCLSWSRPR